MQTAVPIISINHIYSTSSNINFNLYQNPSPVPQEAIPSTGDVFTFDDERFQNSHSFLASPGQDQEEERKKVWTFSEEDLLLDLHDSLGNKWTEIASKLSSRDHNSVKNHFYAKIRKSTRRLNYFTKKNLNEKIKPLNTTHISKMITLLSDANPEGKFESGEQIQTKKIKRFLFKISSREENYQFQEEQLLELKQNVYSIISILNSVKKNNFSMKKIKNCVHRKPEKMKKNTNQMAELELKLKEVERTQRPEYGTKASNSQEIENYVLMMVPIQPYSSTPLNFLNFGYQWVTPVQNYIQFGSNIFINS